ncbi:hypothetical protein HNR53_002473 [Bacillus benzoevorans]|uniref:Uncharacterized protein n=1 Tax=Bacillus benzoevorans TaxID=1456 RepID=A0A7X0HS29_9BACI|nr:hypothetical protein [Bacillus benzoevorans]
MICHFALLCYTEPVNLYKEQVYNRINTIQTGVRKVNILDGLNYNYSNLLLFG